MKSGKSTIAEIGQDINSHHGVGATRPHKNLARKQSGNLQKFCGRIQKIIKCAGAFTYGGHHHAAAIIILDVNLTFPRSQELGGAISMNQKFWIVAITALASITAVSEDVYQAVCALGSRGRSAEKIY